MNNINGIINLIKRRYILIYLFIIVSLNFWLYLTAENIIYNLFPNSMIAMRFNMFQGTTIINKSSNLNNYIWIAIGFSSINLLLGGIVQTKVFINKLAQHFILNWIFISNILILLIIRFYLNIVITINS